MAAVISLRPPAVRRSSSQSTVTDCDSGFWSTAGISARRTAFLDVYRTGGYTDPLARDTVPHVRRRYSNLYHNRYEFPELPVPAHHLRGRRDRVVHPKQSASQPQQDGGDHRQNTSAVSEVRQLRWRCGIWVDNTIRPEIPRLGRDYRRSAEF